MFSFLKNLQAIFQNDVLRFFSPAVNQGSILALSLSCQTHVILQPLIVGGKCDLVGELWFDLSA
jgi:hypothetical protein